MSEFRSRAVRSMTELHEIELRKLMDVWKRFVASGESIPEARGDESYESPERLVSHIQAAARGYLFWMCDKAGRPITDFEMIRDAAIIHPRLEAYMEETLAGWKRHLVSMEDGELAPATHLTRWGDSFTIDQMLEHAIVHPMRHRIQLERILAG